MANMTPGVFQNFMARLIDENQSDDIQKQGQRRMGGVNLANISDDTFVASLPWLEENAARFPPEYHYLIARRLLKTEPDKAPFWWLIGRLRLMYDVARCTDKSTRAFVERHDFEFFRTAKKQNFQPHKISVEEIQTALDWDQKNPPHKFPLLATCIAGLEGTSLSLKYSDLAQEKPFSNNAVGKSVPGHAGKVVTLPEIQVTDSARWVKPESEFPRLRENVRESFRKSTEKGLKRRPKKH